MVRAVPIQRPKLVAIIIIAAIVAVVGVVVLVIATGPSEPGPAKMRTAKQMPADANTVEIEVRSRPRGDITLNGKKIGTTPKMLHVPKSTVSIELGATLVGHPMTKT